MTDASRPAKEKSATCTWAGCSDTARHPQHAKDGEVWANLCGKHVMELEDAIQAGPPKMLSAWVKAQGGAKKAASRMTR